MERCKHDLQADLCAECSPTVKKAARELDRLNRTAMASSGYRDLAKEAG